jgi:hypothetical protein
MEMSQPNNAPPDALVPRRFGIRVTAPPEDFFAHLVGADWQTFHWYATREERDQAMHEMGMRHRYSRVNDVPRIILEPVER